VANRKLILGAGGGGSSGSGCFTAETLVSIPGGQKAIGEIEVGDVVLSFDDLGALHEAKVLKVHEHDNQPVVRYSLWGGGHVDATPNHWVLNQFNAFVEIGTLGADDCVVDAADHLRPIVNRESLGDHTVYNLTVEGRHTFIANGVRVHNAGLGAQIMGSGGGGGSSSGGGKGGGGSRSRAPAPPVEESDTLSSIQFAEVVDLLCEGPIDGVENGNQGIYLNDTPIESSSGTDNFQNFTVNTRNGTQDQTYLPGVTEVSSVFSVDIEINQGTLVARSINNTNTTRVKFGITIPSLQTFETDGDIRGASLSFKFQIQYNGGGFTDLGSYTISGKSSTSFNRDYIFDLDGAFPVDIRVVRTSGNASTRTQSRLIWSTYEEIIDEKFRYPNTAVVGLNFDSRQFSAIPSRKYLVRGLKVAIPSNATVDTTTYPGRITYSGVWDGTFAAATWTNDPAWCLWDLLTNERYGADVPASSLDRYDFYRISQYCNELVSDGKGGQEVRFACNTVINTLDEVYNLIQEMTSVFRGISYYGAGSLVLTQDRPSDSQYLIGPSNVVDGTFSYSGSSLKSRHTTATVSYQDYDLLGEVKFELVEDADAVAKYGIINKDMQAFGCYSQGQARRLGLWALLSEQSLTETVSFSIGIDSGLVLRPGVVIDVADPTRGGTRRNGRIASATTTTVVLDSNADLQVDLTTSPTISVVLPTGLVETRGITNVNNVTVTVDSAFSEAPNASSVWLIQSSNIEAQQFRVVSVAENDDGTFGITALKYNESLYNAIEADLNLTQRDITDLSATPSAVANLSKEEFLYLDGSNVRTGVNLSWTSSDKVTDSYIVKYRLDNDNFESVQTDSPNVEIRGLKAGTLEAYVLPYSAIGKEGPSVKNTLNIAGKTAVPGDVQNLTIEVINANSARLRWDPTVDLDVQVGGRVHIRHTNKTDGTGTWTGSVDLIEAIAGSATEAVVPRIEGEILVKYEDSGGRKSENEASVVVDFPEPLNALAVQSRREDSDSPPFQGTFTNTFYSDEYDALVLEGVTEIDEPIVDDVDAIPSFDYLGDSIFDSGEYEFASTLDLGAVLALDLERHLVATGFYPSDLWDARTELVDAMPDWDGGVVDDVNARLMVRKTNDDPSGSPTYGDWTPLNSGTFRGRAFQFKVELFSTKEDQNVSVTQAGYRATFQQRTEQSTGTIASGASTKSVTFDRAFFAGTAVLGGANAYPPSVGITAQNLQSGDYFEVSNVTGSGFDVVFKNSSDTAVDRNFQYTATGYGAAG
jgi:predicted phage tail protein